MSLAIIAFIILAAPWGAQILLAAREHCSSGGAFAGSRGGCPTPSQTHLRTLKSFAFDFCVALWLLGIICAVLFLGLRDNEGEER